MDAVLHAESRISPAMKWSAYAGLYAFCCGTLLAIALDDILSILADVIGVPAAYSALVFAVPALPVGTVMWWALAERRESYGYVTGVAFGAVSALLTGQVWTARLVYYWGFEVLSVPMIAVLVAFVVALATLAGVVAGVPIMYARRRTGGA